jgi:DNA-binding response OmpR family regulator
MGGVFPAREDEEKVSRFIAKGLIVERFAVDGAYDGENGR